MDMKTSGNHQAITPARERYTTGSVTSIDGTLIGYRQYGYGHGGYGHGGYGGYHHYH